MAYTINSTTVDGARLVCNITVHLSERDDLVCTVPVVKPENEADALAAIEARVKAEQVQFDAAPVLCAIKEQLDAKSNKPRASADIGQVGG